MNESAVKIEPGLAGVPVAESTISFIDGQRARLEYRGIAAETLAKQSSFEETAFLLLKGNLPSQRELAEFSHELRQRRKINYKLRDMLKCLPETGHPMNALQAGVSALGMFHPARDVTNLQANWDATLRILGSMPTIVAAFARLRKGEEAIEPREDLDHAGNFYYMLFHREPTPAIRKVLDACLILHAEHTMNASTFSARVTGSTLADPYCVITAAIGTLAGPLHGGANEESLMTLRQIGSVENVPAWLDQALATKAKIMGMGHRVYKVKDPRAIVLQELAEQVFAEGSRPYAYDIALALEKAALEPLGSKGIFPNVDFFSGVVYESLGIPTDLFTPIFAIARAAGWLAHWNEQLIHNRIYRPKQIYVGANDLEYVPLEKRA